MESYFAGFLFVSWSPDGTKICAGGEDDTISVWDIFEKRLVARCEGHTQWVVNAYFYIVESHFYLLSAGQDGRICIWEIEST